MNSVVTETAYFFHNSSKKQVFLEKVVDGRAKTVRVNDLCRTQWVYRHEALEHFSLLYTFPVAVAEAICENNNSYGNLQWLAKMSGVEYGLAEGLETRK